MKTHWEKQLSCAGRCVRCDHPLDRTDQRILSVWDHQPICLACKQAEQMIADCIAATGKPYGDTAGYCFHHFLPFRCKD